jgi:hypothetical protein
VADLPTGEWQLNANASTGTLVITSVNAAGGVSGTAFGNTIEGFWDSDANELMFLRISSSTNPSRNQVYTGYMFQNPVNPDAGENFTITLTGYFEAFAGSGGTAPRHRFGWFAQQTRVG